MNRKKLLNNDSLTPTIRTVNSILTKKHKAKTNATDYIQERLENGENIYVVMKEERSNFKPCDSYHSFKILDVYNIREPHELEEDELEDMFNTFDQYGYIDCKMVSNSSEKYRLSIENYGVDWVLYNDINSKNVTNNIYSTFFNAKVKGDENSFVGYLNKDNCEFHVVSVDVIIVDDAYISYEILSQSGCQIGKIIKGTDDEIRLNEKVNVYNEDEKFEITIVPKSKPELLNNLLSNQ